MLIEAMKNAEGLSSSEREIVNYCLKNLTAVTRMTADQLAEATCTSKSTVSRLCRKLGAGSYRAFRDTLLKESESWLRSERIEGEEQLKGQSTYEDIKNILPVLYSTAVEKAGMDLNKSQMIRLAERIRRAKKIDFYGTSIMYSTAQSAAFRLSHLGKECSVYDGLNEHYVMSTNNQNEKLVFILSLTGCNRNMVQVARYLRLMHYYTVGIGGADSDELMKCCSEFIRIRSDREWPNLEVVIYQTSVMYVLDMLFLMCMTASYDTSVLNAIDVRKARRLLWDDGQGGPL